MIIAQLSDFHARPHGRPAYGIVDTNAAITSAVEAVLALDPVPDCVLVTGDLAD
jgi:Icc protein